MKKIDFKSLIKDLASPLPEARERAIKAVFEHREEAIPGLLNILELVKAVPVGAPVALSDWSWFLAVYLLTQFREKKALPILLEQFSMPTEHVERLFKDILSEDLPRLLATLCAEDPSPLRNLTENQAIHPSVRASALWGYTILASLGAVPKGEVTNYYHQLFKGGVERRPSYVWISLVAGCAALHAVDLRKEVLKAYQEGLADPGVYSLQEVLREWDLMPEESLKRLAEESGGLIRDVWEEMEYWPWEEEADEGAVEE